jgi:4-amino-4-deoxy-L-arabinose transferase-like glycosyltransferase
MNKLLRIAFAGACILGAGISFLHILYGYKYVIGEGWAPIHVNIEIDKDYARKVSVFLPRQKELYWLTPTTACGPDTQNIVMYVQITTHGFYRGISLRLPEEDSGQTISAIDSISIFIGNKLFYFPSAVIKDWKGLPEAGYVFFPVPGLRYTASLLVKDWTNYYGEFNLALTGICDFLFRPARYAPVYFFIVCLLFLYRKRLYDVYRALSKRNKKGNYAVLLALVVLFGFLLRINGYTRHSGWSDEIYSATRAGNPNLPLIHTFSDPGNPPFYFILLRAWFMLFGWSEESGTLLSVIIGTAAILSLYFFVRSCYGAKTALLAAFFMAVCTFAAAYSQEMRAYILKMFLAPVIAILFFKLLYNPSIKNMLLYTALSVCLVNSHYFGVIFIMANFVFFAGYQALNPPFDRKKFTRFLTANIFIALSFMPYFLYQFLVQEYRFGRTDIKITAEHSGILLVILVFSALSLALRKKISGKIPFAEGKQIAFCAYLVFVPCLTFVLAYAVSLVKPMISFRYLMPVNLPFFLASAAIAIRMCRRHKTLKMLCVFLVWTFSLCLYETPHDGGSASIPGNGTEAYREARGYIALDAASHPRKKSAMLDNAPEIAAYYGYEDIPAYSADESWDVLYVLNSIFNIHEPDMYEALREYNIDDANLLKIRVNSDTLVFKIPLKG